MEDSWDLIGKGAVLLALSSRLSAWFYGVGLSDGLAIIISLLSIVYLVMGIRERHLTIKVKAKEAARNASN